MPNLWIMSSGRVLVVPHGLTHADTAENMGFTQDQAFRDGWLRVIGSERSGWDVEVEDVLRDDTLDLIEGFLLSYSPEDKWTNIETWKPRRMSFAIKPRDIEALGIKDAIRSRMERLLNFPAMGTARKRTSQYPPPRRTLWRRR